MGYPDLRSVIYTVSQAAGLNTYQKLGFGQDGPVWMPRLFIARVPVAGYGLETATMSGNLLSLLLQTGFYFASLAGNLGDRWQHLRPGGRARLALFQLIFIPAAICFYALSRATPADIAAVRRTLRERGKLTIAP